jgi:hypothetical protein
MATLTAIESPDHLETSRTAFRPVFTALRATRMSGIGDREITPPSA